MCFFGCFVHHLRLTCVFARAAGRGCNPSLLWAARLRQPVRSSLALAATTVVHCFPSARALGEAHTRNPCQRLPHKGLDFSFCLYIHTELWPEQVEDIQLFLIYHCFYFSWVRERDRLGDTGALRSDRSSRTNPGTNHKIPATRGYFGLLWRRVYGKIGLNDLFLLGNRQPLHALKCALFAGCSDVNRNTTCKGVTTETVWIDSTVY